MAPDNPSVHVHGDCNPITWISAVVQVITVSGIVYIHIVVFIPVLWPVFRPRINDTEPISFILKTGIPAINFQRKAVDSEPVVPTKEAVKMVIGNTIAVVTAALLPGPVLGLPATGAMLRPHFLLFTLLHTFHLLGWLWSWCRLLLLLETFGLLLLNRLAFGLWLLLVFGSLLLLKTSEGRLLILLIFSLLLLGALVLLFGDSNLPRFGLFLLLLLLNNGLRLQLLLFRLGLLFWLLLLSLFLLLLPLLLLTLFLLTLLLLLLLLFRSGLLLLLLGPGFLFAFVLLCICESDGSEDKDQKYLASSRNQSS